MRSWEKMSSARSRAGWLRNSGAPSSAPSTTKRTCPEWVASPDLIACSILASVRGGKMRRSRQRCSRRCLPMRLMLMLPAPRCAAAAKAAAAATEAAARTATAATAAPIAAAATRPAATCAAAATGGYQIDERRNEEDEHADSRSRPEAADEEPRQNSDETAGRSRTDQPAKRRP